MGAFADERDDAGGADLGGFADDVIEAGALREGLREGDRVRKRRGAVGVADGEDGGVFGSGGEFAEPFGAATVKCDDWVALAGTIHDDEMVRFVAVERELAGNRVSR